MYLSRPLAEGTTNEDSTNMGLLWCRACQQTLWKRSGLSGTLVLYERRTVSGICTPV